jgi:PAS domain S-box-containing protein
MRRLIVVFFTVISVVEDIPVCFSLASASKNRPGFPLIYVNAAFETTTLYSRDEVIGRNCKFLQYPYGNESENVPDAKEKVKIEKMGNALKSSRKLRVSLLNYRKDGSRFYNLFVMKPIFDQNMEYRFVVGLQCEVDESEIVGNVKVDDLSVTHRASRLNERLLQIIPDTVVFS